MIKFKHAKQSGNVYVNPDLISAIVPYFDRTTIVVGTQVVEVEELEDVVIAKLYGAELDKYTRTGDYSRL